MLSTDSALIADLEQDTTVKAVPKVVLEYNMNEMAGTVEVVGNPGASTSEIIKDLFPAKSVVQSFRPSKAGVRYAMLGESINLTTYKSKEPPAKRVYMVDKSVPYTYFLSVGNGGVTINYKNKDGSAAQNILTNKISVRVETGHSLGTISIGALYNGSIPSDGVVDIWYNGTSWTTSQPTNFAQPISISSLTVNITGSPNCAIIEVSPKYVVDISNRIVSIEIQKDDSINDEILPVGILTANSCSIELSTIEKYDICQFVRGDNIVSNKIMLPNNTKIETYFIINDTYQIPQGVFYINETSANDYGDFTINALDAAKFLQETACPDILMYDAPFQTIIWRLLDSIGFVNYDFTKCQEAVLTCRFWWGDRSKTVWQAIQELCRESQTIGYFDEYGKLVFVDRVSFYDNTLSSSWSFRYSDVGNLKPNIVSLDSKIRPTSNVVRVNYKIPTSSNQEASGQPLWTEPAPSTLFAGPFLGISSGYINYHKSQVFSDVIPTRFNSYVLIGDEIIEYDAIQFSSPEGVADIKNSGEYLELRAKYDTSLTPTGKLKIKTRGAFGTTQSNHTSNIPSEIISGWLAQKINFVSNTSSSQDINRVAFVQQDGNNISALGLAGSGSKDDLYFVYKDIPYSDSTIAQIGTSIGFDLAPASDIGIQQLSGIAISWNSTSKTGYLVLVSSTRTAQQVSQKAEVTVYKVVNGVATPLTSTNNTKAYVNVFEGSYFGVDCLIETSGSSNNLQVYVNSARIDFSDSSSPIPRTDTVALVAGGKSKVYFDYLYAGEKASFNLDISSARSSGRLIANSFFNSMSFEKNDSLKIHYIEFGDVIRELYKAEPTYQQAFAIGAHASNELIQVVGQRLGHFKGETFVFNTSSSTVALSAGDGRTLMVYGISVAPAGENYYQTEQNISDNKQVATFDSNWIQDRSAAESLANFLVSQWSKSDIDVEIEAFGNPLLQVGDIITINYTDRGFDGQGKFVIKSIVHDLSTGLETTIKASSIYSG